MRKREILGAAALAAGLGIAAERGLNKPDTREPDVKPKVVKAERSKIKPPPIGEGLELKFDNQPVKSEDTYDAGADENEGDLDGGFGGDPDSEDMPNPPQIDTILEKTLPGFISAQRDNSDDREYKPGDYHLGYPDKNGNYDLQRIVETEIDEDGDQSFTLDDIARVETLEDGSILIREPNGPGKYIDLINCDEATLPEAMEEYSEYRELFAPRFEDQADWSLSGDVEYNPNASIEDLLKVKAYYERQVERKKQLLHREWKYVNLGSERRTTITGEIEELENQTADLQRQILEKT